MFISEGWWGGKEDIQILIINKTPVSTKYIQMVLNMAYQP